MAKSSAKSTRDSQAVDRNDGDLFDRSPPHSIEAESGVIGSMLLDPRCIDDVQLCLSVDDFYSPAHRCVYGHAIALHDRGRRLDTTLLVDRLKAAGDLEAIGGIDFLVEVSESVPVASNAVWYAKIVSDKARLREIVYASLDNLRDAYGATEDVAKTMADAESRMFACMEKRVSSDVKQVPDLLVAAMATIDERRKGGSIVGVRTGYERLDAMLGGLAPGQVIIVAGRPGMGKSCFSTCIAENMALRFGLKVLIVSLEMSAAEITERLLSQNSGVPLDAMRTGTLTASDQAKLVDHMSDLSQASITIDDSPSRNVMEIAAVARRTKRKRGLDLLIVDYLQLIEPDNIKDHREQQVAKISRRLKTLARELDVPVMVLSQLNREADKTGDKPKLSHLRESGAIEQDADVVIFVHRPAYYATNDYEREKERGRAELIVAKARNAKTGTVEVTFLEDHGRFENQAYNFD